MSKERLVVAGINSATTRLQRDASGVIRVMLREGKLSERLRQVEALAEQQGLVVERMSEAELDRISGLAHQGVVLEEARRAASDEKSLYGLISEADHPLLILVLDGVTDPRNLGACLRSAATMGVDAVIVPKDNSAPLTAAAVKTASGGAALVPLIPVVNLSRCLGEMQKQNVWVVGTLLEADKTLDEIDLTGHIAVVLGSEEKGLRQNTIRHCDFLARIPMVSGTLGFNVSVAAGICLYEAQRQRRGL